MLTAWPFVNMKSETHMPDLNAQTLAGLPAAVRKPAYDRRNLREHTVHLGVGGFHRAHQALYLDDLLALPDTERWAECGLGVLPADTRMRDALGAQDGLYTLVERSAGRYDARVIGSLTSFLLAPGATEAALEKLAAPDTRIVSLTITEGGYFIDEASGAFLAGDPRIAADLADPSAPQTSLGLLAEALDRRRTRGLAPFTVMSCDNLQGNGHVTERVLAGFAELRSPALARWIRDHVAFPNSMVDRITPATTEADIEQLSAIHGYRDRWPVVTEPFKQWVIEDTFCAGRPRWERVGAEFTADVAPYEIMKMRLLNGSHLAMAYLGALRGFTYVHELMADPLLLRFTERFMEEVTPVVPRIPGVDVAAYKRTLVERFANPTINDQVTRIASEGSAKIPKWLLPSIAELLAQGRPVKLACFVLASWIHYLARGVNETGKSLDILDARKAELRPMANAGPKAFLAERSLFGDALPANPAFIGEVEVGMTALASKGAAAAMEAILA